MRDVRFQGDQWSVNVLPGQITGKKNAVFETFWKFRCKSDLQEQGAAYSPRVPWEEKIHPYTGRVILIAVYEGMTHHAVCIISEL